MAREQVEELRSGRGVCSGLRDVLVSLTVLVFSCCVKNYHRFSGHEM